MHIWIKQVWEASYKFPSDANVADTLGTKNVVTKQ
jgi:hypothetical protein